MPHSILVYHIYIYNKYTVEALVRDHLGNLEKWSQLELVAYKNDRALISDHVVKQWREIAYESFRNTL